MVWNYNDKFYLSVSDRGFEASKTVFQILKTFIDPKIIYDYGCGYGVWATSAADQFPSAKVVGFDLKPTISKNKGKSETLQNLNYESIDFETNEYSYDKCGLAICLEVVEHVSKDRANLHILRMCQSSEMILFSGAVKGQGGTGHINEQTLGYWVNQFKSQGWIPIDIIRPQIKHNRKIPDYYRNNILLFVPMENYDKILSVIPDPNVREFLKVRTGISTDERKFFTRVLHYILGQFSVSFVSRLAEIKNRIIR
jgi:hypothetical protein